jgi:hypothetical protein
VSVEILIYTSTREEFIRGMCATALPDGRLLATYDQEDDRLIPLPGVYIDEIGSLTKTEAKLGRHGAILEPAVMLDGHHVNILITGDIEQMITAGLPQVSKDGATLGVFERTHLLRLIRGLEWERESRAGEPSGYIGPNGVKLFDPAKVGRRRRIWA